jgi:DNA polymerase III subunit gamma/tau
LLARAARGSMRDGLSLTDQAIAFGAGAVEEAAVRTMLGAVDRGHAVRIVEALSVGDGAALVAAVDALRALGLSASGTLEELAALLQQMAVLQAVPEALDANDPDAPTALRLSALLAPDETQVLYSIVVHGRAELALAPDEYSGLVMVLLRMLAFKPSAPGVSPKPRAASSTPAAKEPATASLAASPAPLRAAPVTQPAVVAAAPVARASVAASEPPPWLDAPFEEETISAPAVHKVSEPETAFLAAAPVAAPPVAFAPSALGERWAALVRQMIDAGAIGALVRELAMQAQCLAFDESATGVACRLRVEREMLRAPAHADKLQAALAQTLAQAVRLELEGGVAEDSPARREAAERARRQAQAEQIIHDDPLVQALMAQYKTARIVPGSVKPH